MKNLQIVPKPEISSQIERLMAAAKELQAGNWTELTRHGYECDWRKFLGFCADFSITPLPASDETLAAFAAWAIDTKGYKIDTVARWLSAINYKHVTSGLEKPMGKETRAVILGARRILKQRPEGRTPLTVEQLRAICTIMLDRANRRSIRDRAILVLGFAAGFRQSSIVNLDLSDVRFHERGLIVSERFSKTDQEGKGREVGIFPGSCIATCPVRAVRDWLEVRDGEPGPLFTTFGMPQQFQSWHTVRANLPASPRRRKSDRRLGADFILRLVKKSVRMIGLDPAAYGSHSLRAGCATAAAEFGASEYEIARRTGHRDMEMVRRYVRPTQTFPTLDPLRGNL